MIVRVAPLTMRERIEVLVSDDRYEEAIDIFKRKYQELEEDFVTSVEDKYINKLLQSGQINKLHNVMKAIMQYTTK